MSDSADMVGSWIITNYDHPRYWFEGKEVSRSEFAVLLAPWREHFWRKGDTEFDVTGSSAVVRKA